MQMGSLEKMFYLFLNRYLLCFEKIIVELKALKEFAPEHKAQLLNYLRASNLKLGLLINFGSYPSVQIERMAS